MVKKDNDQVQVNIKLPFWCKKALGQSKHETWKEYLTDLIRKDSPDRLEEIKEELRSNMAEMAKQIAKKRFNQIQERSNNRKIAVDDWTRQQQQNEMDKLQRMQHEFFEKLSATNNPLELHALSEKYIALGERLAGDTYNADLEGWD